MKQYPCLEINIDKLKENIRNVISICAGKGIDVAGVVKGCNGLLPCTREFEKAGCRYIASSRLEQLEVLRSSGCNTDLMMIRVPMLSEVEDVVRVCEYSLNSDITVLRELNRCAQEQNKTHNVMLMADIGDLREGWWDRNEICTAALEIENELQGLHLAGIGTNIGCYGSLLATEEKLQEIVDVAEEIETVIGRKLEVVSGGATTSLARVLEGNIPQGINMLRIGEAILLNRYLTEIEGFNMEQMHNDAFILKAEVIEVRDKPTYPVGDTGNADAFGNTGKYTDRGIRRRALLAAGKYDYGNEAWLFTNKKGIEIIGSSSDHTIIDVEEAEHEIATGDVLEFRLDYNALMYLSGSENVRKVYISGV